MLSGCGDVSADDAAAALQAQYAAAGGVSMTMDVTFLGGGAVLEYTLRYTGNGDGGTADVLGPESVSGLQLEVTRKEGTLVYDGVRLSAGSAGGAGLTPAGIGPVLWELWSLGYRTQCRYEIREGTDTLAMHLEWDDEITADAWFHRETMLPIYTSICQNGAEILTCAISDTNLEIQTP